MSSFHNASPFNDHERGVTTRLESPISVAQMGVSEQLLAEFDMLRELSVYHANGQNTLKFSSHSIDKLARHIVCRNYGNSCYELSHLCWCIVHSNVHAEKALVDYFWLEAVSTRMGFCHYFAQKTDKQTTDIPVVNTGIGDASLDFLSDHIELKIHQYQFNITASRANYLSCLMEWLMCVIPDLCPMITRTLSGKGHNAIRDLSSNLQQHIYRYIGAHLPPAKLQQRYRLMAHWFNANARSKAADYKESTAASRQGYNHNGIHINDDNLLLFWRDNNTLEGYVKFSGTVQECMAYIRANSIAHVHQAHKFADNIEDNADILYELSANSLGDIDKQRLLKLPKVYSKAQYELIEHIIQYDDISAHFVKSWLRINSFGRWQNTIIQSIRQSKTQISHLTEYKECDYADLQEALTTFIATGQQSILTIVHLLYVHCEQTKADIRPTLQVLSLCCDTIVKLKGYRQALNELMMDIASMNTHTWQPCLQKFPWLTACFDICAKAAKSINRAGLHEKSLLSVDEYLDTANDVVRINEAVSKVLRRIIGNKYAESHKFDADRFIFISEFEKIHIKDDD